MRDNNTVASVRIPFASFIADGRGLGEVQNVAPSCGGSAQIICHKDSQPHDLSNRSKNRNSWSSFPFDDVHGSCPRSWRVRANKEGADWTAKSPMTFGPMEWSMAVFFSKIVQFTCFVRDDAFVVVHINDFLDAKGAILIIVNY